MARPRTKDFDLAPGWRRINGKLYFQPTTAPKRRQGNVPITDGPLVYFIRAKNGALKIGFTGSAEHLKKRLGVLQVGAAHELRLVGAVPGGLEDERRAHGALRAFRSRGEWFVRHRAVSAYVREAIRCGAIPGIVENQKVSVKDISETSAQS